ncbi:hypothetical protein F4806DRAFT_84387 [Annulohypoxylon nitens]|nr:hypothetical protein F4806DRAFT_84387 [Annulohypoxylon nitens]
MRVRRPCVFAISVIVMTLCSHVCFCEALHELLTRFGGQAENGLYQCRCGGRGVSSTNINLHGSKLPRSSRNGNEVDGNMTMGSLLSSLPKTPVKDQYIGLANSIMGKERASLRNHEIGEHIIYLWHNDIHVKQTFPRDQSSTIN